MPRPTANPPERYLMPSEVAKLLNASVKSVARWASEGKLPYIKTLGGHHRYPESEIRALRARLQVPVQPDNSNNGGAGR